MENKKYIIYRSDAHGTFTTIWCTPFDGEWPYGNYVKVVERFTKPDGSKRITYYPSLKVYEEIQFTIKALLKSHETFDDIININHWEEPCFKNKGEVLEYFRDFRIIYDNNLIYDQYFEKNNS